MEKKEILNTYPFDAVGIIVPTEWDPDGHPNEWAIATYDEKLYRIEVGAEGGRLMETLNGRRVRVLGSLGEAENGFRNVTMERYELLDDFGPAC